mgnify:CR=1 FL=1
MNKHSNHMHPLVPLVCSCGKQATTSVDTREPLLLNDSLQEIITLDTVRDTPLTNELLLNGRVSFNPERVAHVYPIFGGNVTSIHAEVGDYVGKGDVLAVIRSGEIADIDKQRKEPSINWLSLTVTWRLPKIWPGAVCFRPGLPASPARASPMPMPRPNVSKKCILFIT